MELKSIAVDPAFQRKGYGKKLIEFTIAQYKGKYATYLVGTGDVPSAACFYEACGFHRSHILKDFFIDHYDHPMFEDGIQLVDMLYLAQAL